MIRGGDIRNGTIVCDDTKRVTAAVSEQFRRTVLRGGEIVLNLIAEPGHSAVVPNELAGHNVSRDVAVIPLIETISARFLDYYMKSPFAIDWLRARLQGSVTQKINLGTLRELPVPLPRFDEQRLIAGMLGDLDDRIALLRDTNTTLEAIALALFKSWFVDFDPVSAKIQGLAPAGMDEATAALFPDGFNAAEIGEIPRGWTVLPVGDAVECVGGATPDTKDERYWSPAQHAWTTPKDLSGLASPVLLRTERLISAQGLARIGSGLLPAGSLLMSSRAPIGYLAIAQLPLAINQGYIAMLPGGRLPPLYMLFWCRQNMELIKARANGSTFMEISKKAFRPIPALVPPEPVVSAFEHTASPLFARIVENERQAQTLAQLRDTLLPRLLSGQLRLTEGLDADAALA